MKYPAQRNLTGISFSLKNLTLLIKNMKNSEYIIDKRISKLTAD
jgi:hypothetical protein